MKMLPLIKRWVGLAWKIYKGVVVTIVTLILTFYLFGGILIYTGHIELPNGVKLVPHYFSDRQMVTILSPQGDKLLSGKDLEVVWNDHAVAGWITQNGKNNDFFYRIGDAEAQVFLGSQPHAYKDFHRLLAEAGLKTEMETKDGGFTSAMRNYLDLERKETYGKAFFQ